MVTLRSVKFIQVYTAPNKQILQEVWQLTDYIYILSKEYLQNWSTRTMPKKCQILNYFNDQWKRHQKMLQVECQLPLHKN